MKHDTERCPGVIVIRQSAIVNYVSCPGAFTWEETAEPLPSPRHSAASRPGRFHEVLGERAALHQSFARVRGDGIRRDLAAFGLASPVARLVPLITFKTAGESR